LSQVLVDQIRALAHRLARPAAPGRADGTRKFWLLAHQLRAALPPLLLPARTGTGTYRAGFLVEESSTMNFGDVLQALDVEVAVHVYSFGSLEERITAGTRTVDLQGLTELQAARKIAEDDLDVLVDVGVAGLNRSAMLIALHPARALIEPAFDPISGFKPLGALRAQLLSTTAEELIVWTKAACAALPPPAGTSINVAALNRMLNGAIQLHQSGDLPQAIGGYDAVLAAHPSHPIAAYLRGQAFHQMHREADAIASLHLAINAAPDFRDAHYTLARRLSDAGRWSEAVAAFRRVVDLTPGFAAAWSGLGLAMLQLGATHSRSAIAHLERAVALEPAEAQWLFNAGAGYQRTGAVESARDAYTKALAVDPSHVDSIFNLAALAQQDGRTADAIQGYTRVVAARPNLADAYSQLGVCLQSAGQIGAWIDNFQRFYEHCPESLPMAVYGLEASMALGDLSGHVRWRERILGGEFPAASAEEHVAYWEQLLFLLLHVDVDREALHAWYRRYDEAARACNGNPSERSAARKPGILRVGYLSGDLKSHVMGRMIHELVSHHDRSVVAPYLYSLTPQPDDWTARFRAMGLPFVDLARTVTADAVARVAEDDLDVLIDCCGHTRGAQQEILARKPARILATHIATPGPVGLTAIDYKLTDALAESSDAQRFILEQLLPVDGGVFPWHRYPEPVALSRREAGIPADAFVCGAFVSLMKLSPRCLALWRRILDAIPQSVLAFSPNGREWNGSYLRWLAANAIDERRIVFIANAADERQALGRYALLDVALDPMPCGNVNGTMEAAAMGVPTVTLTGVRHGELLGNCLLRRFGVPDTIAESDDDYVRQVERLATDREWATHVRHELRQAAAASPVWDSKQRARDLESALAKMVALRSAAAARS